MSVLFLAVPVALVLVVLAVWAFLWAVRNGQLDDLDTPARRILHEDLPPGARGARSSGSRDPQPPSTE